MKVSFIIPLHNRLDLTRRCLESLEATLPPGLAHEIILIDDASTDGTREWLRTLGTPFRVLLNERNLGYAASNNRGAAVATGEVLALLNSDLILTPRWLQPMLGILRKTPRAGVVGNVQLRAGDRTLDHCGFRIELTGKPAHDTARRWLWLPRRDRLTAAVTAACVVIPRALFLELRGFDEGFRNGGEDVDFCFRARAAGRTCHVALRSRIFHHVSASPGRKIHDEFNSRRLAARWRAEFIRLATRAANWDWSRKYIAAHCADTRDYDPAVLTEIWRCLLGVSSCPYPGGVPPAELAMRLEEDRWGELLGPATTDVFRSSLPAPHVAPSLSRAPTT